MRARPRWACARKGEVASWVHIGSTSRRIARTVTPLVAPSRPLRGSPLPASVLGLCPAEEAASPLMRARPRWACARKGEVARGTNIGSTSRQIGRTVTLSLEELTLFGQRGRALRGKSSNLRMAPPKSSPGPDRGSGPHSSTALAESSLRMSGAKRRARRTHFVLTARWCRQAGFAPPVPCLDRQRLATGQALLCACGTTEVVRVRL